MHHEIIDYYDEIDFDSITSIIERLCEFEKYPEYYFSLFCEYNSYRNNLVKDLERKLEEYFDDYE